MEVVEITTKTSEYYINLVDKTALGFDRINSDFESSFAVNKMLSNICASQREVICERKS